MTIEFPEDRIGRRPDGKPQRELMELIQSVDPCSGPIKLVHVTPAGWAGEIIRKGQFQLGRSECFVYGTRLLYFFVNRPAYRVPQAEQRSNLVNRFPAVFVLDPAGAPDLHHVIGFDSGAAFQGRYPDAGQPNVYIDDYELGSSLDMAARLISFAFGTAERYFDGLLLPDLNDKVPYSNAVGRGYLEIARIGEVGSNRHDQRASAIEVASRKPVPLAHVEYVVLPDRFIEDNGSRKSEVLEILTNKQISHDFYTWRPGEAPDHYTKMITDIIRAYLHPKPQNSISPGPTNAAPRPKRMRR